MDERAELHELAAAYGVDTEYWDWQGEHRTVSDDTLRAVLAAFDVDAETAAACHDALGARRAQLAARRLPPTVVARAGRPQSLDVDGTDVQLELEDGSRRALTAEGGSFELPADLPTGYHRLVVDGGSQSAHLIVTPDHLTLPSELLERPGWGLATQLYSVRSRASWGVGDLADLRTLAEWAAGQHGADFVLVNPVHAGEIVPPLNPSPYLPTSRRFANPIYLRVENVPEFTALPATQRAEVSALGDAVRGTQGDRVERDPTWTAKLAALARLRELAPADDDRVAAFIAFRDEASEPLDRFATWCALCEVHGNDWRAWPPAVREPDSDAVADFAREHADRIEFFAWLQWLLEEQLTGVQADAVNAGMRVGIVHDVAVGVSPSGADAWANQGSMATSVTVGAPPDAYSQLGQDWRQPPWRPDRLAESGYRPFREMFGSALRHCGGLRVDHIIGLFRLWWIPQDKQALDGTYVHYDHEALIGVLVLEAERAGAVVIGEDLGNVEPFAHDYLRERGLLGTSILWFEFDRSTDEPLPAPRWRQYCLASVTTHDLPPTAGYLAGDHIRLRDSLHLLTRSLDEELAAGHAEQQRWLDVLHGLDLLTPDAGTEDVVVALHRFLTSTPSALRSMALTDAVGDRRTQNQPGTVDEYPNWRVPLAGPDGVPLPLEDVLTNERAARLLAVFESRD